MSSTGGIGGSGSNYNYGNVGAGQSQGTTAPTEVGGNAEAPAPQSIDVGDGRGFKGGGDISNAGRDLGGPREQGAGATSHSGELTNLMGSLDALNDESAMLAAQFKEKTKSLLERAKQLGFASGELSKLRDNVNGQAAGLRGEEAKLRESDDKDDLKKADELAKQASALEATSAELTKKIDDISKELDSIGKEADAARAELDKKLDAIKQKIDQLQNQADNKKESAPEEKKEIQTKTSAAKQALEALLTTVPLLEQLKQSTESDNTRRSDDGASAVAMKSGA